MFLFSTKLVRRHRPGISISLVALLFLSACGKEEIQVYSVPKETRTANAESASPGIRWTTPPGWQEAAGYYGEPGTFRSVADIVDQESLARVRETKQQVKAAARAKAAS